MGHGGGAQVCVASVREPPEQVAPCWPREPCSCGLTVDLGVGRGGVEPQVLERSRSDRESVGDRTACWGVDLDGELVGGEPDVRAVDDAVALARPGGKASGEIEHRTSEFGDGRHSAPVACAPCPHSHPKWTARCCALRPLNISRPASDVTSPSSTAGSGRAPRTSRRRRRDDDRCWVAARFATARNQYERTGVPWVSRTGGS